MSFQNFAFKAQAFKVKAFSKYVFTVVTDSLFPLTNLLFGKNTLINTGTGLASGTKTAKFIQSSALTFDGLDDRIALKSKVSWFDTTTNAWTVEFYVSLVAYPVTFASVISNGLNTTGFRIGFTSTGKLLLLLRNTATTNELSISTDSVLPLSTWTKVRVTYDGSRNTSGCKIYFNDVNVTVTVGFNTLSSDVTQTSLTTLIGSTQLLATPTYQYFLSGSIFGLKAWKSVVSPSDTTTVFDLFNYNLAENNGAVIYDNTSTKNHGAIVNFNLATCWTTKQDLYHYNITKGFSSALIGNKTDGVIEITDAKYKNRGTSNFWIRTRFIASYVVTSATEVLCGCAVSGAGTSSYAFYINNTGKLNFYFKVTGGTTKVCTSLAQLVAGSYYDAFVNVDRAGNVSLYLNNVLQQANSISADAALTMSCTNNFTICAGFTGASKSEFAAQIIYGISTGNGLLPTNGTQDSVTPDIANLIGMPYSAGMVETIFNVAYLATAGTLYNSKIPSTLADVNIDMVGYTTQAIADGWHNGAETKLDFTNNGINSTIPATYNAVVMNSAISDNKFFYRQNTNNGLSVRNDRYLIYSVVQTGSALAKILKFITTNVLGV